VRQLTTCAYLPAAGTSGAADAPVSQLTTNFLLVGTGSLSGRCGDVLSLQMLTRPLQTGKVTGKQQQADGTKMNIVHPKRLHQATL